MTVPGGRDALALEHLSAMPSGAIVANAGHFDLEIDVAAPHRAASAATEVRPGAVAYTLPGGNRVIVLAEGRLVGQSRAEASPAEDMDLTFATQALAVERLPSAARRRPRARRGRTPGSWAGAAGPARRGASPPRARTGPGRPGGPGRPRPAGPAGGVGSRRPGRAGPPRPTAWTPPPPQRRPGGHRPPPAGQPDGGDQAEQGQHVLPVLYTTSAGTTASSAVPAWTGSA